MRSLMRWKKWLLSQITILRYCLLTISHIRLYLLSFRKMFSQSDVPPDAEERMAKISKSVFDYFKNQKLGPPPVIETIHWDIIVGLLGTIGLIAYFYHEYKRTHPPTSAT